MTVRVGRFVLWNWDRVQAFSWGLATIAILSLVVASSQQRADLAAVRAQLDQAQTVNADQREEIGRLRGQQSSDIARINQLEQTLQENRIGVPPRTTSTTTREATHRGTTTTATTSKPTTTAATTTTRPPMCPTGTIPVAGICKPGVP